jgi:hypothetical protein
MSLSAAPPAEHIRAINQTIDNKLIKSSDGAQNKVIELSITPHAKLRWLQRTHNFTASPADVWERATAVNLESAQFGEVRYDERSETLLCVNESTLVTVLSAQYEEFSVSRDEDESQCDVCGFSHHPGNKDCACRNRLEIT